MQMKKKNRIILNTSLTVLGLTFISTGIILNIQNKVQKIEPTKDTPTFSIKEEIKLTLKNIEVEINTPLSEEIEDYIEESIKENQKQELTLDLSNVDIEKSGTYTYTITYQKQVFEGQVIIKEKEEKVEEKPKMQQLTLKEITLKLKEELPTELNYYIMETLTEEEQKQVRFTLPSKEITKKAGTYQYTIGYGNMFYTGKITVVEDQPIIDVPSNVTEKEEENTVTKEKDTDNTETKENNESE